MNPTLLSFTVDLKEARIDVAERAIRDVVLIKAGMSLNRKLYTEQALKAAVDKFEGIKAYDSHLPGVRRVAETTGWYANVRFVEDKKALVGDRYFTSTQVGNDVWAIAQDIVSGRAPSSLAGLSINAVGVVKAGRDAQGDFHMVESITKATSIDDVGTPAAGGTYLQASHDEGLAEALIGAMTFEQFIAARPDFTQRLQKEIKATRASEQERAAQADAAQLRTALTEAGNAERTLTEALEATSRQLAEVRLELAVEKVIALAPPMPQTWLDSLREELISTPPKQWLGVVEKLKNMARDAGYTPSPARVEGAHQQVRQPSKAAAVVVETLIDWDKVKTPADQARLLNALAVRS